MSVGDNKELIQRVVDAVMNTGSTAVIPDLFISDSFLARAFADATTKYHTAFPDVHVTTEDMIAEGNKVAVYLTMRGTNSGPWMGRPPTGKSITCTGVFIFKIADGKIASIAGDWDQLGMLQQLGVVPQMVDNGEQAP